MINGVCLAPLNFFIEQLEWDLIWDPVLFQIATKPYDDIKTSFCLPAYMIKGQIMAPVHALAEAMGYEVWWLEQEQMIKLKKP
ncbi:MAG: hypothetical protein GX892_16105 [Thermoanaerobacteraceae bacterium]|nr:hypothetical protein [Thermoanaerobacteraceae bacterium]